MTLIPGQAQKETSVNEALHLLDVIVAGAVEEAARTDPPATPAVGTSYIVAEQATGEWSAMRVRSQRSLPAGGNTSRRPMASWSWRRRPERRFAMAAGHGSRSVGSRQAPIPDVTGGTTADAESRAAIAAILRALRAHGLIVA